MRFLPLFLSLLLPAHAFTPSILLTHRLPCQTTSRTALSARQHMHTRAKAKANRHTHTLTSLKASSDTQPDPEGEEEAMHNAARNPWFAPWSNQSERDKFVASAMAFAAVAGTALVSFMVEQGGTVVVVECLRRFTKAGSLMQTVEVLTAQADSLGWVAVPIYTAGATVLQLAPVCNGILMCMAMGVIFGTPTGVAIMSISATISSVLCLINSRYLASSLFSNAASSAPPIFQAIGNGISDSKRKTLLLVGLVRLSPVVPFCWSNYLFGLTPVPILPYAAGTFLGTLPGLSVFVSAGVVGKAMATGSVSLPPALIVSGCVATASVLAILGKVSQKELAKLSHKDEKGESKNSD
mmetsp:Transcript_48586/g.118336  ORF Transcript_48586/g.118336 Transcript_48586/m.118336 type:complete len:353 (-) Transcript_48586:130-1188(-)|eukprot:CAMPEP_0206279390 /NCGR_PEP_ID=MMETSP0047_2-20121206/37996_1 /ASSEMBLY_ACC=CAM_ASM_000192 /TAXON_ID=195065 /ORGANISM="Chroomonas mesostigmatica_cf, Strain CCMP1168" /LENGTH=352 /DNA_ID=CAMNT_0053709335 /DNA_START=58 /DNA_END=1116 /DNA_ORIENTATION=-